MQLVRRIIISLGAALFVACCAAVLLTSTSTHDWQLLSVPTASMQPNIPSGSLVLVHRVSEPLKVGDVITYTNPTTMKGTITHRIVRIDRLQSGPPMYVTKGDANKTADPLPAIDGLVQGKVVQHVPYVGTWFMWAKTWVGIVLLVYLPAMILLFAEMRKLVAYWRLTMPKSYRLFGYQQRENRASSRHTARYAAAVSAILLVGVSAGFAVPVYAALTSNVVTLGPNTLSVAGPVNPPPTNTTTCTNNTNIRVNNSSTQTAGTGSASSSNNTTGGSATSGNASNTNATNVNVGVTNGC